MKAAEAKAWWVPWIEALPSAVWGLVSGLVVLYAGSRLLHHWQKRLEQDKFKWPKRSDTEVIMLTPEQWHWLLRGFDLSQIKAHQAIHFRGLG